MNKFIVLLISIVFLPLSNIVNADPIPKPDKCPSVESFQSIQWDIFDKYDSSHWIIGQEKNGFDTSQSWKFLLAPISAGSKEKAITKATRFLGALKLNKGPVEAPDAWSCIYISKDAMATVFTPKN